MDPSLVTAVAALSGSLVGALSSFASGYLTQRHQTRRDRLTADLDRREELYTRFNELAAELFFDALDNSLDKPAKLVGVVTLTGRIRLTSSAPVLEAAQSVIAELLDAYRQPPIDYRDALLQRADMLDPLVAFTQACRVEREQLLRQF